MSGANKSAELASTHSPQELSSVLAARVRVIDSFQLRYLDREIFRRDSKLPGGQDDPDVLFYEGLLPAEDVGIES